ncbi:membrane protein [Furfurilactobacillus curtus]|uniref:Membrane protein n=2 Tax=Furfurilactobacillus curtus TaxID=1746200 RepID=A0ABQ5JMV5_9LACO
MDRQFAYSKVPLITGGFWLAKLISTGLGESVSDFSVGIFGQKNQVAGAIFTVVWSLGLFSFFLIRQLRNDRYQPINYWLSVALLAVFGTFSADGFKAVTGLHYFETTMIFFVLMLASFAVWYSQSHDLSIHHITSRLNEVFYWLTVAFSFMLGTAAGDWMASSRSGAYNIDTSSLGLGFLNTGLLLGAIFLVLVAFRRFGKPTQNGLPEIISFWAAYALTRPIGASFADYFGYDFHGGVLGNRGMSLIWFVAFVIVLTVIVKKSGSTSVQLEQPVEETMAHQK